MRKFISILLVSVLVLGLSAGALAAGFEKVATPSQTKFVMDGKEVTFDKAYNIEDSNYIQLRSVAQMLNGTKSQFNVYWDDTLKQAIIETGAPFTGIKPVVVEKDDYKIGDTISMKSTEVTITNVFTTNILGSSKASLGEIYYGVSFTILASEQPYSNVGLGVYNFINCIITTKGERYASFSQIEATKIVLNQKATGTIYYTINQSDQIASILVQDVYGNSETVST